MGHPQPDLCSCLRCPIRRYCPLFCFFCLHFSFRFFDKCGGLSWYTNIRYLVHYNLFVSSVFSRGLHSFSTRCFPALFPCLLLAVLLYRESNSLLRFKNVRVRSLPNNHIMEFWKMFLDACVTAVQRDRENSQFSAFVHHETQCHSGPQSCI